jgi:hypothetical protein
LRRSSTSSADQQAVPLHELGFFGQPEEDRVHGGGLYCRFADFAGQSTEVGEKRGSPRLGGEFRLFRQVRHPRHEIRILRLAVP